MIKFSNERGAANLNGVEVLPKAVSAPLWPNGGHPAYPAKLTVVAGCNVVIKRSIGCPKITNFGPSAMQCTFNI